MSGSYTTESMDCRFPHYECLTKRKHAFALRFGRWMRGTGRAKLGRQRKEDLQQGPEGPFVETFEIAVSSSQHSKVMELMTAIALVLLLQRSYYQGPWPALVPFEGSGGLLEVLRSP